ncbi:hypothetical protein GLW04_16015 [Halobacillus litoralis]|uniref:Uncharacterized protein n=1 Tax=Halobacillus litoralis TaxID=45668 RepID=A0A845DX54_9BACI|nr:hypothetical protein [Halobacillus litoralis]MYL21409.1 hypothetical protein [Halobacillus litoralis]
MSQELSTAVVHEHDLPHKNDAIAVLFSLENCAQHSLLYMADLFQFYLFRRWHEERSVVTPAGPARAEDPLGQMVS